ncbi:MAG: acetolactate synthase large subunit [Propionibacteriaceae bacterium]|jgi:acetolactate synthase-1/2/3 large subunit|nr:acetolactate synthase large subunit [Propionibacteriaceae bacterium]
MASSENRFIATMTGARALVETLERLGVEVAFGLPGGAILPLFDPLFDSSIRHILCRHEQGAAHAAEGYATATGRVGVCIATSGPGATNLVTGLADAYMDSVPIVAITGQVSSAAIGTDAFQEADIRGITFPITKHSFLVKEAAAIPQAVAEAFHIAATGRPGPVLVDVAKDALNASIAFDWPVAVELPGYRPTVAPHYRQVKQAANLIAQAARPVVLAGGGVVKADAADALRALVDQTGLPVVTTLMARGALPDSHRLNFGMPGMHGAVAAVGALQRCDLMITVGARFDDRVTGQLSSFAPAAKVIHCDIDPAEISKNRLADLPVVGDAGLFLEALGQRLAEVELPDWQPWLDYLDGLRRKYPTWDGGDDDAAVIQPQAVIRRLSELAGPEAVFVTGVGQHQMWAAHFVALEKPRHWLTSGGAGTMGYCVPAAMGAKVGRPEALVWGIDGDGCFQMTNQELATCALNGIPVKIAVINNQALGMVRQWQTLFYGQRYSNTDLHTDRVPDFVKLAEALGCVGLRATRPDQVDAVIAQAMAVEDRPVVVEFVVPKDAMVWPMVAAGASNDDIKIARDLAPIWEEDDL